MKLYYIIILLSFISCGNSKKENQNTDDSSVTLEIKITAPLEKLATDFKFTEGPAVDASGNVYFSDIPNSKIWIWTLADSLKLFRENSNGSNGLYFDKNQNLLACEGNKSQVSLTTPNGDYKVIASKYQDKPFNSTNDLWVDDKGGVYVTDPQYSGDLENLNQGGMHLYYIEPDYQNVMRVREGFTRPNGLIGTPDGKTLYVSDRGAGKTYRFDIQEDGSLMNKMLFVEEGSDGMTIDQNGNIYITTKDKSQVDVFSAEGQLLKSIEIPEAPTNVCFGGKDRQQLFITARTSLYRVGLNAKGVQ
jgi:gluconolactonase